MVQAVLTGRSTVGAFRDLILLGFALYLPSASVSSVFIILYSLTFSLVGLALDLVD